MNAAIKCKITADYICEACGFTPFNPEHRGRLIQTHHIVPRSLSGGDHQHNLIALCAMCHATAHALDAAERFHLIRAIRDARGMYFLPASTNYHTWSINTVHISRASISMWDDLYLEDMRIACNAVAAKFTPATPRTNPNHPE
jgi:hypothetical protein